MLRIGIVGATGYTGAELVRLLMRHPGAVITFITSETYAGRAYGEVYPALTGRLEGTCEALDPERVGEGSDVIFTALPHTKAMACVPRLLEMGKLVIDLSADFRLRDVDLYESWYEPHLAPELLRRAVYGLPELHREEIRRAKLVANPGCYPTSAILAAAPLLKARWIDPRSLIVNAASGVTGAGRSAALGNLFCEVNEGLRAYKVAQHRHTPEMEQEMSQLAGRSVQVTFAPHLVPLSRGILTTLYANLVSDHGEEALRGLYGEFYGEEPFVRIMPQEVMPNVRDVRGTNLCDIGVKLDCRTNRVVVLSVIDNLVKGASGQAIQNMNLALGLEETAGLEQPPLFL